MNLFPWQDNGDRSHCIVNGTNLTVEPHPTVGLTYWCNGRSHSNGFELGLERAKEAVEQDYVSLLTRLKNSRTTEDEAFLAEWRRQFVSVDGVVFEEKFPSYEQDTKSK